MAKTLDAAGVKRLIQEIKGANKNLNAPIPISTENTTESMAQNVKNIADYVAKAKAAGIANVNGMAVTCIIDGDYSGVGYLYGEDMICGTTTYDDLSTPYNFVVQPDGLYTYNPFIVKGTTGQVTSSMLDKGARRPIILTSSTTEVDEETYQKLLSDDVDVVYNTINMTTKDIDSDKNITMTFSYAICTADIMQIASIDIQISSTSPHLVVKGDSAEQNISPEQVVNKSTLSPVLQEIDLRGTDAERKAKLDQFEADWKALTGADDLTGARFVGKFGITDDVERIVNGIMTYCPGDGPLEKNDNCFYGICNGYSFSEQKSQIAVKVSCTDGSLTITPLFSHLEAIIIKTGNTPEGKAANVAAIKAYVDNLISLGVDTTKGYMIPAKLDSGNLDGFVSYHSDTVDYPWSGIFIRPGGLGKFVGINKDGFVVVIDDILISGNIYKTLTTTSKGIIPAINEVNALAKSKQDALTSGTNIKTVNGQSLLGSGDIAISGGGDVTAAGDNTFTGNNVFSGIAIADILDGTQYQITGDNGVLMFTSGATMEDIQLSGVATPTYSNSAANKSYVDTQISTALGTVLTQLQNI